MSKPSWRNTKRPASSPGAWTTDVSELEPVEGVEPIEWDSHKRPGLDARHLIALLETALAVAEGPVVVCPDLFTGPGPGWLLELKLRHGRRETSQERTCRVDDAVAVLMDVDADVLDDAVRQLKEERKGGDEPDGHLEL